jgi:Mn2+/Fe2+ NRAMP family transporter
VAPSNYRKWEKIMIFLCLLDLFWIILAMMSIPNIHMYHYSKVNMFSNDYLMMTMALIGTTIAPWQLFFQNSCVLDKKLTIKDYNHIKMETFIGAIFIVIAAICMILIGCLNSGVFTNVPDFVKNIFTNNHSIINFILDVLILNASIIGTAAVSLSTAWVYAENKQINKSLNQKFSEAKPFYIHYYGSIVLAGLIALLPCISLNAIIIGVQIIACIFLPYQLIVIQILSNNKKLMKDQVNTKFTNVIMNSIISIIVILSVFLLCQSLHFL